MSPTAPTYLALYKQLGQAKSRIRELEARENDLLTEIRTLCAAVTERTHRAHARAPDDLTPSLQQQRQPSPTTNHAGTEQRCTAQARRDALDQPPPNAMTTRPAPQHTFDERTF